MFHSRVEIPTAESTMRQLLFPALMAPELELILVYRNLESWYDSLRGDALILVDRWLDGDLSLNVAVGLQLLPEQLQHSIHIPTPPRADQLLLAI
jgi:hypothetical protein